MATVVGISGWKFSEETKTAMTSLQHENVEALSQGEGATNVPCYSKKDCNCTVNLRTLDGCIYSTTLSDQIKAAPYL